MLLIAAHVNVTDLLATLADIATGADGMLRIGVVTGSIGPTGVPVIVNALLVPAEFEATIEKVYVVPFVSPVTVHV